MKTYQRQPSIPRTAPIRWPSTLLLLLVGTLLVPWLAPSPAQAQEMNESSDPAYTTDTTVTSVVPARSISPVVECVAYNGSGTYTAYFGYYNKNDFVAELPVGTDNRFTGGTPDRGQPAIFEPGRQRKVFTVQFDGSSLVWNLTGKTATASSNPQQRCETSTRADFDSDTSSDILWRNTELGTHSLWYMDGFERMAAEPIDSANSATRMMGTGDFNGDELPDLLWRNETSGANAVWLMDGTSVSYEPVPSVPDTSWKIVGIGDFDADDNDDVLWRNEASGANAIWLMDGASSRYEPITTVQDTDWQVQGVGDMDGDGRADIFWRHANLGVNAVWFMDGTTERYVPSASVKDLAWVVVGLGEFNNDGMADVLWRHTSLGANGIWTMDGATAAYVPISTVSDLRWKIAGIGDFDRDGISDLLWNYMDNSTNAIWLMDGAEHTYATIPGVAERTWQVVGLGANNYDQSGDIGPASEAPPGDIAGTAAEETMLMDKPVDMMAVAPPLPLMELGPAIDATAAAGSDTGEGPDDENDTGAGAIVYLPAMVR